MISKIKDQIDPNASIYSYPVFPDAIIMFRNAAWKYPVKKIIKIGLTHGAYSFKRTPKSYYYNMFDLFLMTSEADVLRSREKGVYTTKTIGYPKSDTLLDDTYNKDILTELRTKINLNVKKLTLLFTATWDGSGMSAIDKWFNRLPDLYDNYNILVNLHHKMSLYYINYLRSLPGIYFIDQLDIYPYLLISDVCISDTSSLIAEFCVADKPIVTFTVRKTDRTTDDISSIIDKVSVSIDNFEQLPAAINESIAKKKEMSIIRKQIANMLISPLDGKAGFRAANEITKLIPDLKK
ncbi:MAG: CDP-glycerol glycerophosphotransferase family protein [Candidatus Cloacimonetes bacterium]|nr:CDP-glycerol glycerophosphotransferase family protein [Candidatus Cloacimonadota bacterium]